MHALAVKLAAWTECDRRWEAMRYEAIGKIMQDLVTYCAVCDCHAKKATR